MIKREFFIQRKDGVKLYKIYSTNDVYIKKKNTDEIYDLVIDVEDAPYEYEETDVKIEEGEE